MTPPLVEVGGRFMTAHEMTDAAAALGMRREVSHFRGRIGAGRDRRSRCRGGPARHFPANVVALTGERFGPLPAAVAVASYRNAATSGVGTTSRTYRALIGW
jgi:hypothetical protein